ncbi:unnamed protein product, partial [Thlaspi arvense]
KAKRTEKQHVLKSARTEAKTKLVSLDHEKLHRKGNKNMGSLSNTPQLPVIYLSDQTLKPGSSKWVEVRSDVRKALEEYGGFEVSYDRVSEELKKSVLQAMEELFALPVEAKQRNVSPKPFSGYSTHNGLSESMGIQDPHVLDKVYEFTQLLRPDHCDGNKSISETIQTFSEKLSELDIMVRRMVMESFGIEKYLDKHLNSTNYRLRLMKYIAPPDADATNVLTKDDKWIRLKPSHNSFVVMAGDSLYLTLTRTDVHALMNGRLTRPFHRVRVTEKKKTRYSIALFSAPTADYIIDTPKELVDEKHPRIFEPFNYNDLMSFYHSEAGRKARSTLDAFCAVSRA